MNERLSRWKVAVERLIDNEYWEHTTVSRVFRKKFKQWLADLTESNNKHADNESLKTDHDLTVYVALHAHEGHDLKVWQGVLKAFPDCGQGRPVYASEAQVRRSVERKKDPSLEGYAVLRVATRHVLKMPVDKVNYDAWGQPLLVLRPEAIKQGEVTHFVHANQKSYTWKDQMLREALQNQTMTD